MKRVVYVALAAGVIGLVWLGNAGRSGGQGQAPPLTDHRFCADANGDGAIDISDPVTILTYLFTGGAPPYCIAQNLSLEDLFVKEGQSGSINTEMLVDGAVTAVKIDLGSCDPPFGNICQEIKQLQNRLAALETWREELDILPSACKPFIFRKSDLLTTTSILIKAPSDHSVRVSKIFLQLQTSGAGGGQDKAVCYLTDGNISLITSPLASVSLGPGGTAQDIYRDIDEETVVIDDTIFLQVDISYETGLRGNYTVEVSGTIFCN